MYLSSKPLLRTYLLSLKIILIMISYYSIVNLANAGEQGNSGSCAGLTSPDLTKKNPSEQLDVFLMLLDKCDDEPSFEEALSRSPLLAKIEKNVTYKSFPKMICAAYLLVDERRVLSICLDSTEKTVVRANSEIRAKKTTGDYKLKARGDGND